MAPTKSKINDLLKDYDQESVKIYSDYIISLWNTEKDGKYPNQYWMGKINEEYYANCFRIVKKEGLDFDGKNITLQSTGISYNYVALKNKMLLVYPESKIDLSLVYKGDDFSFSKESGKITYKHIINTPFDRKETDVIGGYVVIKNNRGEFLTLMSLADIEKHKASAKTQYIWKAWLREMYSKTLMKKACSEHFKDIFSGIEEEDNKNYDPTITTPEARSDYDIIEEINDLESLKKFWEENKGKGKDFASLITRRKMFLIEESKKSNT